MLLNIINHIIYKVQWLFMSDDYYLNVLHDENNFKLIRKLSVDEYDKFNKASVFMQKLNVKLYFFRMVDYSYIELKNFEKAYNDNINYYPLSVNINEIIFNFFKLLNDYLSSVTLFLNQYEVNVKRDYEKIVGEKQSQRVNVDKWYST